MIVLRPNVRIDINSKRSLPEDPETQILHVQPYSFCDVNSIVSGAIIAWDQIAHRSKCNRVRRHCHRCAG